MIVTRLPESHTVRAACPRPVEWCVADAAFREASNGIPTPGGRGRDRRVLLCQRRPALASEHRMDCDDRRLQVDAEELLRLPVSVESLVHLLFDTARTMDEGVVLDAKRNGRPVPPNSRARRAGSFVLNPILRRPGSDGSIARTPNREHSWHLRERWRGWRPVQRPS